MRTFRFGPTSDGLQPTSDGGTKQKLPNNSTKGILVPPGKSPSEKLERFLPKEFVYESQLDYHVWGPELRWGHSRDRGFGQANRSDLPVVPESKVFQENPWHELVDDISNQAP